MLKRIALAVLLATCVALAQDKTEPSPAKAPAVYRLEYTIIEMDGTKKVSSRTYTLLVEDRKRGSTRVGTRVPVPTNTSKDGTSTQYSYSDIGVNLDATASVVDAATVRLDTIADVTSLVSQESGAIHAPVIRSCRDQITNVIPLDKVVTLTTQDDPSNNTSMQIQVIAKLVK